MLLDAASSGAVGLLAYAGVAVVVLRLVLSYKSVVYALRRLWRWADEWTQVYQFYEVPRFASFDGAENPLFRKAAAYVASLPSLEDADAACVLSSASKTNGGFSLQLGQGHTAHDAFLGARLAWTNGGVCGSERLVLRVRRHDRTRVLRPYLQHVESVADEMELRRRELRLFANAGANGSSGAPRWAPSPFTHPATLDAVAMDPELKARVRADLENFLKGRAYYHRLGRVWRRSYLLYGPAGTGKTTFAAAMARFLGYDIYDIDLSRGDAGDLRSLLLHTTPRSLILVEDLDRYLKGGDGETSAARAARVLSFMDGVASCCGEERVMVFTMRGGKEGVDAAALRPGRLDVHIQFTMCDFEAFKALASNYLGLKDHKLYPQVEEGFHAGARLSAAELGEIMLANRASPSRALRTVITALQHVSGAAPAPAPPRPHRRNTSWSGHWEELAGRAADGAAEANATSPTAAGGGGFAKDAPMREFKKLYGLIKIRSRKDGSGVVPVDDTSQAPANGRPGEHGSGDAEKER